MVALAAAAAAAELCDNRLTQGFLSFWVADEATLTVEAPMTDSVPNVTAGDAVADVSEAETVGSAAMNVLDASDEDAPMTGTVSAVEDELETVTVLPATVGSGTAELDTVPTLGVDEVVTVEVDELGIKPPGGKRES